MMSFLLGGIRTRGESKIPGGFVGGSMDTSGLEWETPVVFVPNQDLDSGYDYLSKVIIIHIPILLKGSSIVLKTILLDSLIKLHINFCFHKF